MLGTMISLAATLISAIPIQISSSIEESEEIIKDFDGNNFILKEGDNSYEIHDNNGNFIEDSYEVNSPYYNLSGEKYYLGPMNYFVFGDEKLTNLYTGCVENIEKYKGSKYVLKNVPETRSSDPVGNPDKTDIDINGFTVIKRDEYFRNLPYFPRNYLGDCGNVALSILLGYYDTFYNDDFIPNDLYYDAKYYKDVSKTSAKSNEDKPKWELDYTASEPLIKIVKTPFKDVDKYDYTEWSIMPGTRYSMRDYLFDNYMHNVAGIGDPDIGYPMANVELRNTFKDYMEENCSHLLSEIEIKDGSVFYTRQRPKEYISQGLPTILVLLKYDTEDGSGKGHDVVAYGYSEDKFLTHFGHNSGSSRRASVVISNATINSYFTFDFTGEHKHSANVYMEKGDMRKYICGCGKVHSATYSISPDDWNFDERYYFENEGIKENTINIGDLEINTERLRCGYIEKEFINLSPNRYNAGDAYLDLTFNENIYKMDTNISFWSNGESLYSSNGDYAYIKYRDFYGEWKTALDLLNCNLSMDRENQNHILIDFPLGTKQIRFEAHKENPDTNRNKGRISLGNLKFIGTRV